MSLNHALLPKLSPRGKMKLSPWSEDTITVQGYQIKVTRVGDYYFPHQGSYVLDGEGRLYIKRRLRAGGEWSEGEATRPKGEATRVTSASERSEARPKGEARGDGRETKPSTREATRVGSSCNVSEASHLYVNISQDRSVLYTLRIRGRDVVEKRDYRLARLKLGDSIRDNLAGVIDSPAPLTDFEERVYLFHDLSYGYVVDDAFATDFSSQKFVLSEEKDVVDVESMSPMLRGEPDNPLSSWWWIIAVFVLLLLLCIWFVSVGTSLRPCFDMSMRGDRLRLG
jgi:hypothetical protein